MAYKRKYMRDLFGKRVPIRTPKCKREPTLKVSVSTRLTTDEHQQLEAIAAKFGISTSKYCHDAIVQAIKDHECILAPEHRWLTD